MLSTFRLSSKNQPLDNQFVIDLFAEVIGILAQSRFNILKRRFMVEFNKLRTNATNSLNNSESIGKLLMGIKYFRIKVKKKPIFSHLTHSHHLSLLKMVPIEDFEASFQFLNELAQYFIDVKDIKVKHALAGLFIEILVPVGAVCSFCMSFCFNLKHVF